MSIHYLNGKMVDEGDLLVSARDLGFTRGYAVFDFLITYNGKPFMLSWHIDRLFHSAKLIGLRMPWSKSDIAAWVMETLTANADGKEKAIKIIVSGGVSDSLIPKSTPTIVIVVDPRHFFPMKWYEEGVGVITVHYQRYIPGAKTNNYIEAVRQIQIADAMDAIEPVYYDNLQVFEGATSNIFAVINEKLVTPKSNILFGITREVILAQVKLAIPVEERDFTRDMLMLAGEVFLTGSNKEVMPVTKIDGNKVGKGVVGPITKEVMQQFQAHVSSP